MRAFLCLWLVVGAAYGNLPLSFEARGKNFVAHGTGYSVRISPDGMTLSTFRMVFAGANPGIELAGVEPFSTPSPALPGQLPALFRAVRANSVYPGVDVIFHGNGQRLEYDFEVAPRRDPRRIALRFEGTSEARVDEHGDLAVGRVKLAKPVAWQAIDGLRTAVAVRYEIGKTGEVRLRLGRYDHGRPLTIDPVLLVDTYLGTKASSSGDAIALDSKGNVYVAGDADPGAFPAANAIHPPAGVGSQTQNVRNVFVTKWSPDGSQLLYATVLGGSGFDTVSGIKVDNDGNAFITGSTSSRDFPVTDSAFQKTLNGDRNAFVARLSADGSKLIYSTLLGGGSEQTGGIAIDTEGDAYVVGTTQRNFPVTLNAFQTAPGSGACNQLNVFAFNYATTGDAFVVKLSPDGSSLLFSTLLGGGCGEAGYGIGLDASGHVWVTGATYSQNFPVTADALQPQFGGGFGDGFLTRFSRDGDLEYSTYLGGSGYDTINAITFDAGGNIWLTGGSAGFSQRASPGAFQPNWSNGGCFVLGVGPPTFYPNPNAFAMKLNATGTALTGLTYMGAFCRIEARSIAVDEKGYPWIGGFPVNLQTSGYSMPTVSPLRLSIQEGFIGRFSPDLTQLVFSTWFDDVSGLALDSGGNVWVSGSGVSPGTVGIQPFRAVMARIDPTPPAISLDTITSFYPEPSTVITGIAPGKLVRLVGKGIGPAARSPGQLTPSGSVATSASGVQVLFGGVPAPLLGVSAEEIECVVPFGTAPGVTTVQVLYSGAKSNEVLAPVKATALDILGVFNADFTVNSASNPAEEDSIITAYITGAGQTTPPGEDGKVGLSPLPQIPQIDVRTVTGGSIPLPVTFAAAAYGQVAGVVQVNFVAPHRSGTQPVGIAVEGNETYFNIAVK